MPEPPAQAVVGCIDCHTDFHVVAALDPLGRLLGTDPAALQYQRRPRYRVPI